MEQIRLKAEYVSAIQDNPALLGTIAQKLGRNISTIERWLRDNDEKLTMLTVMSCVRDFLKLEASEQLTETKNIAA